MKFMNGTGYLCAGRTADVEKDSSEMTRGKAMVGLRDKPCRSCFSQ